MFKRIAFFTDGSLSYLIFLGTFLYAIGFIGNFGVPTTLDGAQSGPLAVNMTLAHMLFSIAMAAYILIAIQLEERDLVREHGDSHEAYQRAVPMLIPFTRRRQNVQPTEDISARAQINP